MRFNAVIRCLQGSIVPEHLTLVAVLSISAASSAYDASTFSAYDGSTFEEIRAAVFSDPYEALPQYDVRSELFGKSGENPENKLRQAARRTLAVSDDLLDFPGGQKVFQPNGICFTGDWQIDKASRYGGYFAQGSSGLLLIRASVSLAPTTRGHKRAFALAGKLFPTSEPTARVKTANFFAMENFLGTRDAHFTDAVLDNNPVVSGLPGSFQALTLGLRIKKDFRIADMETSRGGANVNFRPLYSIAEAGVSDDSVVVPTWMQLRVPAETPRVLASDFRDELRLEHYPGQQLTWEIRVAESHPRGKESAQWQELGRIRLTDYVISRSCDTRLHFAHPVIR